MRGSLEGEAAAGAGVLGYLPVQRGQLGGAVQGLCWGPRFRTGRNLGVEMEQSHLQIWAAVRAEDC